ncbi:MAG: GNAT family N-acetyltransferase [Planctomycetota bacterium]
MDQPRDPPDDRILTDERIALRPAGDDDLERLVRWSGDFERESGDDHGPPVIAATQRHFAAHPDHGRVLLIEQLGQPVGFLIFVRFWSNEFRGPCVILDELYVQPEHRGGTGLRVLRAFEQLMRAHQVRAIDLEVLHRNPRAQALYQRAGFVSDRVGYVKQLRRA